LSTWTGARLITQWLHAACRTFVVGNASESANDLVLVTKAAMEAGINVCKPGVDFKEVGAAIEAFAKRYGYRVGKEFIGHGVGKHFHAQPWVLPFKNNQRYGKMQEGQTFTIEPILHMGKSKHDTWKDGWTVVTRDKSLCAQFEHTVLVTADGVERLTAYE
jgi:methionyl aminopeptidase